MLKYMTHPNHGRMPVYSDGEIEYNSKFGWSVEEDKQEEKTVESPEVLYEKKFGKKPHHKMKQESIIAALED